MSRDLALFLRQLAILMRSGVHILNALESLERQTPRMAASIRALRASVSEGRHLSQAMASQPGLFSQVARSMIAVGERGGGLVNCLEYLADWVDRDRELAHKTINSLIYPVIVLAVATILGLMLVVGVFPSFASILRELNAPLPLPTRIVMGLSMFLSQPLSWLGLMLVGAGCAWVAREYLRTDEGRAQAFVWALYIPLFGHLLRVSALGRYADILYLLLRSGTPLLMTLRLAGRACGDPRLAADAPLLEDSVRNGHSLGEALSARPDLYTESFIGLVQAGEESDRLHRFIGVAARNLALEAELQRALIAAVLEPVLLMLVSGTVGALVLSVLLPIQASLTGLLA